MKLEAVTRIKPFLKFECLPETYLAFAAKGLHSRRRAQLRNQWKDSPAADFRSHLDPGGGGRCQWCDRRGLREVHSDDSRELIFRELFGSRRPSGTRHQPSFSLKVALNGATWRGCECNWSRWCGNSCCAGCTTPTPVHKPEPGPIAGASLPVLAVGFSCGWLWRPLDGKGPAAGLIRRSALYGRGHYPVRVRQKTWPAQALQKALVVPSSRGESSCSVRRQSY